MLKKEPSVTGIFIDNNTRICTFLNQYAQMDTNYDKMHTSRVFCVCTSLNFLQLLLCCPEISLKKYPLSQLTMLSNLVVKQNFLNTNVIVNYHILIICNWSGYSFCQMANFCKMYSNVIWSELPYTIIYSRKVCIFLWYFDKKIKLYAKNVHPKIPIGRSDSGGWFVTAARLSTCLTSFHIISNISSVMTLRTRVEGQNEKRSWKIQTPESV